MKNKKYIARTAAEILGSGFALEEQQVDGSSILDFLRRAACFLFLRQQYYEWRLDP